MDFQSLISEHRLLIYGGPGGVGKTTLAAAAAFLAAKRGKKVLVLTIDPARRLANALGLKELGNQPKEIHLKDNLSSGRLFALMLDPKRTFDSLIERYSPNQETKDAILSHPLYQKFSNMIAGSQEYMAMEKLYELSQQTDYELLILDTPPAQHALDFLDAPRKMTEALGSRMLQWFLKPSLFAGGASLGWIQRSAQKVLGVLDRVTGIDFLNDLSKMLISTSGLLGGFQERAQKVQALLQNPKTAFVLVAAADTSLLSEILFFTQAIAKQHLSLAAVIVNRVHLENERGLTDAQIRQNIEALPFDPKYKQALIRSFEAQRSLIEKDKLVLKEMGEHYKKGELILTPYLEGDVNDLDGLANLAQQTWG